MNPYRSCNCKQCRSVPSSVKAEHKKTAHRAIRRAGKAEARGGREAPQAVSTGYKA